MTTEANPKQTGFRRDCLNHELFSTILEGIDKTATLLHCEPHPLDVSSGNMCQSVTSGQTESDSRIIGHCAFCLSYKLPSLKSSQSSHDIVKEKIVVLKSKARHKEMLHYFHTIAPFPNLNDALHKAWHEMLSIYSSDNLEHLELDFVKLNDPVIQTIIPDVYWTFTVEEKDIFVYAIEYFQGPEYSNNSSDWKREDIISILQGLATLHGRYYGCTDVIPENFTQHLNVITKENLAKSVQSTKVLLNEAKISCPAYITDDIYNLALMVIENINQLGEILESCPYTLIHRDCSPNNICIRKVPKAGKSALCLYDWEQAGIGPPQVDLAFFLIFLYPNTDTMNFYVEKYVTFLKEQVLRNKKVDPGKLPEDEFEAKRFHEVLDASMMWLLLKCVTIDVTMWRIFNKKAFFVAILENVTKHVFSVRSKYSFLQTLP